MNPVVSVIITVYNGEKNIVEAIDSILNQSFSNFELIIINDGSIDSTEKLIKGIRDERIKYHKLSNRGAAAARNSGIQLSLGKYICILDADDIALKDRLKEQVRFLDLNPDFVIVGSNVDLIDAHGDFICTLFLPKDDENIRRIIPKMPFIHPSIMYRKEIFNKAQGYPEYMLIAQDRILINKLLKYGKGFNLQNVLTKYRISPSSNSVRNSKDKKKLENIIRHSIKYNSLTEEENNEIREIFIRSRSNSHNNQYHYELFLTKKYIWNSFNKNKARKLLFQLIKKNPVKMELYILLIILSFPKIIIKSLYSRIKAS